MPLQAKRKGITHILIIEDDEDLHEYLRNTLQEQNYLVTITSNGASGLRLFSETKPDLVILDIHLPDITGESVLANIRKENSSVPVIMLTATADVETKVKTLQSGADDYVIKPFDGAELVARVQARLRGGDNDQSSPLQVADLTLDPKKIEVQRAGKVIDLSPQEFKLLEYLMRNKGVVLTREIILDRIWLYPQEVETRVVDVYVGYLRKKIDTPHSKKLFHSIRGFGYTLKE